MTTIEVPAVIQTSIEKFQTEVKDLFETLKTAEGGEREKLQERQTVLEDQIEKLSTELKNQRSRPNFSGVEFSDGNSNREKFSPGRMVHMLQPNAERRAACWKDPKYGYEVDVFKHGLECMEYAPEELKAQINATTGGEGGFFIPVEVMPEVIPLLESEQISSSWGGSGVTRLNGLVSNISMVKETNAPTAYWVDSETATSITESVAQFGTIDMQPHVLATLIPITHRMMMQPSVALDQYVQRRAGTRIGLEEDRVIFLGDGANAEPTGIFNLARGTDADQVKTYDWDTGTLNWGLAAESGGQNVTTQVMNTVRSTLNANAGGLSGMGWAMSINAHMAVGQVVDANYHPLFAGPDMTAPSTLYGHPVVSATSLNQAAITDEHLIFGPAPEVNVGRWGGVVFAASNVSGTDFATLRTSFRAVTAIDVGVTQPGAFTIGLNVNTTAVYT